MGAMLAVVFPGQGSQAPGMGKALFESSGAAREVFDQVAEATGVDVRSLCFRSDDDTLRQTQNAQLALYTVGLAAFRAIKEAAPDLLVKGAAGHSVGEYAALAAAGCLSVGSGARLVKRRGELMAESGRERAGAMAAVLGLSRQAVEDACGGLSGVCVVANDNCPGQLVVSGDKSAVEACAEPLKAAGAKRVLPLNVSGAFHSPLMKSAAKSLGEVLRQTEFQPGDMPVYSNVTAAPATDWAALLEAQLRSPVRWTETILKMAHDGFGRFIECGHGSVLAGLVRRTDPGLAVSSVGDPDSLTAALGTHQEALK